MTIDDSPHGAVRSARAEHRGHSSHDVLQAFVYGGRRRHVFARLVALSGAHPGDRVLDVGCGAGYFTRLLAEAVAPRGTAHGVDVDSEVIVQARHRVGLSNCTFSVGDATSIDAPDGSYDVVVSSLMIHHLPEAQRARAVREMFRLARPGGAVLIAEFRPPRGRIGRWLVRRHSPAMADNRVDVLEPMVREAGFVSSRQGDVRPWIRYVRADKPLAAQPGNDSGTGADHTGCRS